MKKNLLLTTALVAFAMPALADLGTGDWEATASEIAALNKITDQNVQSKTESSNLTLIYVKGAATVADKGEFINNKADSGGVFATAGYTNRGSLTVNTATFSQNEAYFDGGAIANYGVLNVNGATFNGNIAQAVVNDGNKDDKPVGGGAIALGSVSDTTIANATFEENVSYNNGGAIGTRLANILYSNNSAAKLDIDATFTSNRATNNGGAIYNTFYSNNGKDKGDGVTVKGIFTSNRAGNNGGAIYNDGHTDKLENDGGVMTIIDSTFTSNTAGNWGGAVYGGNSDKDDAGKSSLTVKGSTFEKNSAKYGGALATGTSTKKTLIENTTFKENSALEIGAIGLFGANNELTNVTFTANKATSTASNSDGAGALFLGAESKTILNNVTFDGNISAAKGGAIATRTADMGNNKEARFDILNSTFKNNVAATTGGAFDNYLYSSVQDQYAVYISGTTFEANEAASGGAIYNHGQEDKGGNTASTLINNSTFKNNEATENGGAIFNEEGGAIKLTGTNVFSGNTVSGTANDIHNDGTLTVSGDLTLDGGITGTGTVNFLDGSKLTINLGKTTIDANTVSITNSKLIFANDVTEKTYDFITATQTGNFIINVENSLYNIEHKGDGKIYVEAKSTEELASSLGATTTEASALLAATSDTTSSSNQYFNDVAKQLSQLAQEGEASASSEASKLGASDSPIVPSQETAMQNALFGVVAGELNGVTGAIAQGKSSGDYLKKATAWIRGLFNKADHENTNKASGFTSDTYGVAMGIDQEISSDTRLGFGYANAQTDIDSAGRKTDVDTNTLFVYSKYKPADWYINSMLAYSWSEYDEKKSVLGADASAKYDIDTLALHAMYGYETYYKCYDITPEFGLRYMHIEQDAYTNKLGSRVAKNSDDVLTAVAGVKVARNYRLNNGTTLRPEFNAAVTYDLFDADNSANVLLANNAAYRVNGEKLNRLGFEIGGKLTNNVTDKVEVSAGYFTRVREDYQDHTLMFDAKYNF